MIEERQSTDYLYDAIGATTRGIGQAVDFVSWQTRERPVVIGSVLLGTIGAIIGARIAQIQAMRRRKNFFERTMDSLGDFGTMVTAWMTRKPTGPIYMIRERGGGVFGGLGGGMIGKPQEMTKGPESAAKQVGYALSLIPLTMAFIRNPLVRDVGFRYLSRKVTRR